MQEMLMSNLPILPLYNPKLLEAVRIDRLEGWVPMLGGIGNTWSFCRLELKQSLMSYLTNYLHKGGAYEVKSITQGVFAIQTHGIRHYAESP
jgi:hypothetical protein